jgi:hypothetical protein
MDDDQVVPSELVYVLVGSEKEHTAQHTNVPWDVFYADRIITHFRAVE